MENNNTFSILAVVAILLIGIPLVVISINQTKKQQPIIIHHQPKVIEKHIPVPHPKQPTPQSRYEAGWNDAKAGFAPRFETDPYYMQGYREWRNQHRGWFGFGVRIF